MIKGSLFHNRYLIVKALEKGSGGSVYMVHDTLKEDHVSERCSGESGEECPKASINKSERQK